MLPPEGEVIVCTRLSPGNRLFISSVGDLFVLGVDDKGVSRGPVCPPFVGRPRVSGKISSTGRGCLRASLCLRVSHVCARPVWGKGLTDRTCEP